MKVRSGPVQDGLHTSACYRVFKGDFLSRVKCHSPHESLLRLSEPVCFISSRAEPQNAFSFPIKVASALDYESRYVASTGLIKDFFHPPIAR